MNAEGDDMTTTTTHHAAREVASVAERREASCDCPPCPGRGNDGHGLTHCAECCFGTGVEADIDCPGHGATNPQPPHAPTEREEREG